MEKQLRVLLLFTVTGSMFGEGCSNEAHGFNFTDAGYCSDNMTYSMGKCWGTLSHLNITIDCADDNTEPKTLSWCTRNKTGFPQCVEWTERDRVKCLSEIYETCYCSQDDRGRPVCQCDRYLFWRVYPFIYIFLGLSMVVIYIVCHIMRMCKKEPDDEKDEDLTKIPEYVKQGENNI
ncbi:uncharacterized protein LOC134814439 [Bolinopsis microptera]|uniref:uncharacterized protein LOC134814439 n=1 Tax=Bolinopsis microptera TaxID=2820187 RepID=UPI0030791A97